MNLRTRRAKDKVMKSLTLVAFLVAIVPLFYVIGTVISKGLVALNWQALGELPPLGFRNAIIGTFIILAVTWLIALPVGIMSGVYIAEYRGIFARAMSFLADVMSGVPSIIAGIVSYVVVVATTRAFGLAGSVALSILMLPVVIRSTEEALKSVPNSLREASTALGAPKWRTTAIALNTAKGSIATGVLLSSARVMGETAPLIMTAGYSQWEFMGMDCRVNSLAYVVYEFLRYPDKERIALGWSAALILIIIILAINIGVRILTRRKYEY